MGPGLEATPWDPESVETCPPDPLLGRSGLLSLGSSTAGKERAPQRGAQGKGFQGPEVGQLHFFPTEVEATVF